jgi:hypothetical protein
MTEREEFIKNVTAWNHKKSFTNFMILWHTEFRNKNPFFKVWRIFRNTVNGRYAEIEEKQYLAW